MCLLALPAGCGSAENSASRPRLLLSTKEPDALAALPGGGLVFGGRSTGIVRELDANGKVGAPLARLAVSSRAQRGLLSLAVDPRRRLFAAWTQPDLRLVVGQIAPGAVRILWRGPRTVDLGNGGHLAFAPGGRLVIGIGDMEHAERTLDPRALNGKLLSLAPDGPPDQRPRVISAGWTNPFAFAFTPAGVLRVADNSPGPGAERLAVGNSGATPALVSMTAGETAPSGLAVLGEHEFVVCGYVSHHLDRYRVGPDGLARPAGKALANDCRLGVAALGGRRLVYATQREIKELTAPR